MLKISDDDRKFLTERIENIETLLAGNDLNALLEAVEDYMLDIGFDENWDINDDGRTVERLYDRIYFNN